MDPNSVYEPLESVLYRPPFHNPVDNLLLYGSGIAGVAIYLKGGGRRHPVKAYRTGSLIALNTRIVDDLLDGEHIEQIDNQQAELDRLLREAKDRMSTHGLSGNAVRTLASYYPMIYTAMKKTTLASSIWRNTDAAGYEDSA